jgi:epoxide hydrolase-like predicted phosphatase
MKINTIIWDIGGVLERTEDFTPRQQVAERLRMTVDQLSALIFGDTTQFRVQLGQISREEHLIYVQQKLGLTSRTELDQVFEEFFGGDHLDMELVDHIRELKTSYTTAVLSNYSEILRERINKEWQIGDAFDHLIISAEVGHKKPDPKIYQIALEKTNCSPGEAVFIDDFIENIRAAEDLGIHGIHFQNVEQALNQLHEKLKN